MRKISDSPIQLRFSTFLFLGIILILIVISLIMVSKIMVNTASKQQPQNNESELSGVEYVKRTLKLSEEDADFNQFITRVPESELIGLKCADQVIVNDGKDEYWWRNFYSHDLYDQIEDPIILNALAEANESMVSGKKIVSGRVCQTEYGNVLLHYVVGDISEKGNLGYYDGIDADAYITVLGEKGEFKEGILLQHDENWPYAICNTPIQLTNKGALYMICTNTQASGVKSNLHVVDLKNGEVDTVISCSFTRKHGPGLERICS